MSTNVLRLLLDASLRSLCLAVAAGVVLWCLRVGDNRAKHRLWTIVMVAMLAMPALEALTPVTLTLAVPRPIRPLFAAKDLPIVNGANQAPPPPFVFGLSSQVDSGGRDASVPANGPIGNASLAIPAATASPADLILAFYATVALLILMRLLIGWTQARALRRACRSVSVDVLPSGYHDGQLQVLESDFVQAPLVVGLWRPAIVLPMTWRRWTDQERRAAIAHERAHAESRDALVGTAARVLCAVFWFHPLAWWLERHLAALAERAADDAAVLASGDRVRYAEVLVSVLRAVHDAGARVGWGAVGMRGRTAIDQRISRLLNGAVPRPARRHTMSLATASLFAVVAAVSACRLAAPSTPFSAADEEREAKLKGELRAGVEFPMRLEIDPEPNELAPLEALVAANSDDLKAFDRLLTAYWRAMGHGPTTIALHPVRLEKTDVEALTEARRRAILHLIASHPEASLAAQVHARIYRESIDEGFPGDPAGFAQAREAWLTLTEPSQVDSRILENAARFFEIDEPARAETLLLRAAADDHTRMWSVPLGLFYGRLLAGDSAPRPGNRAARLMAPRASTAFAMVIRQKLTDTKDAVLLTATAWELSRHGSGGLLYADFDAAAWAQGCYERALQLDPTLVLPHTELISLRDHQKWKTNTLGIFRISPAERYPRASSLAGRDRLVALIDLASQAISEVNLATVLHDSNLISRQELARDQSRRAAQDLLQLGSAFRSDPDYGTAIYTANMVLGSLAQQDGNTKLAVTCLRAASDAPASEWLMYSERLVALPGSYGPPTFRLDSELLKVGQSEVVARFYERLSQTSIAMRRELREAAAAVRRGERARI